MNAKTWKAGKADAPWKVEICQRDKSEGQQALDFVTYVVGGALENFTGEQIAKALRLYSISAEKSIESGGLK